MLCEGEGGGEEVQNWVLVDGVGNVLVFWGGKCGGIAALVVGSYRGAWRVDIDLAWIWERRGRL